MRHIVAVEEAFIGCGRSSLVGFRRLELTMCFLVVRVSQTMGESVESSSSPESAEASRDFFPEVFAPTEDLITVRRAFEAFKVCRILVGSTIHKFNSTYLF